MQLRSDIYQLELVPLDWEHFSTLEKICQDDGLAEVLYNSVPYVHQLESYFNLAFEQRDQGSRIPFAVIDLQSNQVIGTTSCYDIQQNVPRLDIGYTWYAKAYQRSYVNRVCKYLLLQHAFESMQMKAVGLRTDHLNTASQKAIEGIGAKLDGVLRCHMLRKDGQTLRDSYVYSILQNEWPEVRTLLQAKILKYAAQQNFEI
ncbi:GNAT family N-acetyltransferase [Acinetobacter tianfuensis]|uniref:N-acetyltransferase n=1 Tax=Acinetobacter tianfuensis TaxID=2419603 RepID=A0A3A8E2M5_9GAMM|nr:GNAT family protein [Acinetobacter tianfuensis]RKG29217.1 N-acetyltransferase [Acinetobacter tianfuensis]